MKNKKKAFTLVELLAVIVILAIILVIAIPQIIKTIKASKLSAMESSAKLIATEADKDFLSQLTLNQYYSATSVPCTDVAKLSDDYESCDIVYDENGVSTVTLVGAEGKKFAGITCVGTKDNMVCEQEEPIVYTYITYVIDDNNSKRIGYYEKNGEVISNTKYERPSKEGYSFFGWYKDREYTQKFNLNENNIPEEISEITVYAKMIDASLIYTYTIDNTNNVATITGLTDYGLELYNNDELLSFEFPSKLEEKNVTKIHPVNTNNKFNGKSKIKEVIIPDTVMSIAGGAFGGIPDLAKLTMPIDIYASNIFDTTELEELHLTKGSTGIGVRYYYWDSGMATEGHLNTPWYQSREYGGASASSVGTSPLKVTIDEGITKIGDGMFYNSNRIELINGLPNSLESIENTSFYNSGLNQELNIPNNIIIIGQSAFQGSKATINCNIPSTLTSVGASAFNGVNLIGSCTIPETLTTIGQNAFTNTKITELKIKSDSNNYPNNAFNNISTLKKLEIPITINGAIASGTSELEELHLTKGSTGIGVRYYYWDSGMATEGHLNTPWYQSREYGGASASSVGTSPLKVTIDEGITKIGDGMFYNSYRVQLQSSIAGITIGNNALTNSGASVN